MEYIGEYFGRLANHGSEAENKNVVTFFFRHGQRGGNAGFKMRSAKIMAVTGMAKRKLLFRTGTAADVYAADLEARKKRKADLLVPRIKHMLLHKTWYAARRREMADWDFDGGPASGGRRGGQERRPEHL